MERWVGAFLNITPHVIRVGCEISKNNSLKSILGNPKFGEVISIETSGIIARVNTIDTQIGEIITPAGDIPIIKSGLGKPSLPREEIGVIYIVSRMVLDAAKDRKDLVAPDTGPSAIRDERGNLLAVTRFIAS